MALTRIPSDLQDTYTYPRVCDSIDTLFDGVTRIFTLKVSGANINSVADSRSVQVFINGLIQKPVIGTSKTIPWITPYTPKVGDYEISGSNIIFYIPPIPGDVAYISVVNAGTYVQSVGDFYSPMIIAIGD